MSKTTCILLLVFASAIPALSQSQKWMLTAMSWQDYNSTSSAWVNAEREEYAYTGTGRAETSVYKVWNPLSGKYLNKSKIAWDYVNDVLAAKTYSMFDANSQAWTDTLSRIFSYNADGKLASTLILIKTLETNQWVNRTKEEKLYDDSGNVSASTFSEWDASQNNWANIEKAVYTYDADNRLLTYIGFVRDELFDEWIYFDKEEYAYADAGKTVNYTYYEWNEAKDQWAYVFKDYSTYYNNGLNWGYLSYYWDAKTSTWIDFTKEIHDLDANGNVLRYAEYEWNTLTSKWDYYDKEEYVYDSFGNLVLFIDYNKNEPYNQWIESLKETYAYNTSIDASMLIVPFDEPSINGVYFKSQILAINAFYWDVSKSAWRNASKGEFAYSQFAATISDPLIDDRKSFCFYPNPVSDFLVVSGDSLIFPLQIAVFNASGQLVRIYKVDANGGSIPFVGYSHGLYWVVATLADGKKISHKVIVGE